MPVRKVFECGSTQVIVRSEGNGVELELLLLHVRCYMLVLARNEGDIWDKLLFTKKSFTEYNVCAKYINLETGKKLFSIK